MKKTAIAVTVALLLGVFEQASAQSSGTRTFEGSIAEKYPIVMSFNIDENDNITGDYYYKKVGAKLRLHGTVDEAGRFEIEEHDSDGNLTGRFQGEMIGDSEFAGKWSSPDGVKNLPFLVKEIPLCRFYDRGCAAEVRTKTIALEGPYEFQGSINWPMVFGVENQGAQDMIRDMIDFDRIVEVPLETVIADFEECGCGIVEVDYAVNYNHFPFLDLEFNIVGMGAHLYYDQKYYTVDVRTGKRLRGSDLFRSDRMQDLAALCNDRLQENIRAKIEEIGEDVGNVPMLSYDYVFSPSNLESFSLGEFAMTFHFGFDFPSAFRAGEPSGDLGIGYDQLQPFLADRFQPFFR